MSNLAAMTATDATIFDVCHRIIAQGIGRGLDGERRAPRKPDARAVAGAHVLVHPEARTDDPFAGLLAGLVFRAHAALPVELALALDDDRLDALGARRQGIAQGLNRFFQII